MKVLVLNGLLYFDGLLYFVEKLKSYISIVLVLNKFQKKLKNWLKIKASKLRNSIMCGYFCIGLIDFMFADKTLVDFRSIFSHVL